ncbi:MAG: hypothetical protein ABF391_03925 [Akkermansiaceae bacterium]
MKEIWEQATIGYNMPLTILLGLVLLFWTVSLLGIGDFDADLDVDVDLDVDGGAEGQAEGAFGFLLRVVNAQDIPLMLVLSLLTLFMWAIAIASNFYFNPEQSTSLALVFLLANFFASVLLVKIVTQPLRKFFRTMKNDKEHQEPLIGSAGHVKSRVLDSSFGQCEVVRPKGAPALLNCRLAEGEDSLVRGDQILVIGFDEETQKFIIKPNQSKETN